MKFIKALALIVLFTASLIVTSGHALSSDKTTVTINNMNFEIFISENKIQERIKELATQINQDYANKAPLFICVLTGAVFFFTDLLKQITVDCRIDFIKISSYHDATKSSGKITIEKNISSNLTNRDVIIVEDIIDTGLSITLLKDLITQQNPRSVKFASFLLKKETAKVDFPIDYVGFEIPSDFVIGYGLDLAQKARNLPAIYRLKK